MGNLQDFNRGMSAYNSGKMRQYQKSNQERRQLILDDLYARKTNQPLPPVNIPPKPADKVSSLNLFAKAKQHDDRIRYEKFSDIARVREDLSAGRISVPDAIRYLEAALSSL